MTILRRLICLIKGHKWEKHWERTNYDLFQLLNEKLPKMVVFTRCKRCGKILKDVP